MLMNVILKRVVCMLFLIHFILTSIVLAQTPNPREFWAPRKTIIGKSIGAKNLPYEIKTPSEVENYFRCYLTDEKSKQNYLKYKAEYAQLTEWASQTFDMPRALSMCMIFKESTFDNAAKSEAGALGVAQITPDTFGDFAKVLRRTKANIEFGKQFDEITNDRNFYEITKKENEEKYGNNEFIRCAQYVQRDGPYYWSSTDEERKKSTEHCLDFFAKHRYRPQLLSNYGMFLAHARNQMEKSGDIASLKRYFPNSKKEGPISEKDFFPPENIENMVASPLLTVAAQMYYLKEAIVRMDNQLITSKIESDDVVGYLTLLAGGYNVGINALLPSLQSGNSIEQWCRNLAEKGGKETKEYMLSVRRCLTKADYSPRTSDEPSCTNKDAKRDSKDKEGISDPCKPSFTGPLPRPQRTAPRSTRVNN